MASDAVTFKGHDELERQCRVCGHFKVLHWFTATDNLCHICAAQASPGALGGVLWGDPLSALGHPIQSPGFGVAAMLGGLMEHQRALRERCGYSDEFVSIRGVVP